MLNWLKNKFSNRKSLQETDYDFRWYKIGDNDNPFNKRILDIRPFTQTVTAATDKPEIAQSFMNLRESDGKYLVNQKIENENFVETNLEYPHNGEKLEGVIFKAGEMECKWDIYIYDEYFYFARSWSGELHFKAQVEISEDKFLITKISFDKEKYDENAANDVHFLMKSHASNQPFPHKVLDLSDDELLVARVSFSLYGNRACYACFDDITNTEIKKSE